MSKIRTEVEKFNQLIMLGEMNQIQEDILVEMIYDLINGK